MTDPADSAIRQAISYQGLLLGHHKELLEDATDAMQMLHTNIAALSSQARAQATSTERSLETLAARATNTNLNMQTRSSELRPLPAQMARFFNPPAEPPPILFAASSCP
ncbi:hypothetical protein NHX12_017759 [Muraenolepis orangiensis]|uniref:Uncharacterized protein n=1 Tax=Muraenolepis orangiensis TaxID=630683 RepID=A0A9Q0EX49_9TELE|nr:hypothetical protein NHX12_017759 [Muraenolepis orangiensis]